MSQTAPRDPYDVLGVARDADETTIKKAFRKLARKHHPDVNPDDPDAAERFKEASEAYEILADAQTRATYDRYGHDGLKAGGFSPHNDAFGSLSDILGAFFGGDPFGGSRGGGRPGPRQGEDVGAEVKLTLAEAYAGAKREVKIKVVERCGHCGGNAAEPGTPLIGCQRCGGQGILQAVARTPFGQTVTNVTCDVCGGDGRVPEQPCRECGGKGRVEAERTLDVDLPAGIADGQRLRVSGRGHAGSGGGPAGDLYVLVRITADEALVRDGDDLVTVVPLSIARAALGANVAVEHPRGEPIDVEIAAGVQPGEIVTVRGMGMPSVRGGRRGNLNVVVDVAVPRRLNGEQRELLERLEASIDTEQMRDDSSIGARLRRLFHRQ